MTKKDLPKLLKQVQEERDYFETEVESQKQKVRKLEAENATLRGVAEAAQKEKQEAKADLSDLRDKTSAESNRMYLVARACLDIATDRYPRDY